MDRNLARHIVWVAFREMGHLTDSLPLAKAHESNQDLETCYKPAASIAGDIIQHIIMPLTKRFPDIDTEMHEIVEKYGELI